jgi:hypothetical protein
MSISVNKISRNLKENNVDSKTIEKIIGDGDIANIVQRMDEMLDHELKYMVLDACACCTKSSKERDKQCKEYGKKMADKSLEEKIKNLDSIGFENVKLVDNKTLSVSISWIIDDKFYCSCGSGKNMSIASRPSKNKKCINQDRIISLSWCFCCAGNSRYHLQNALRLKLKTKKIISSPMNSRGKKPCKFLIEIIE